MFTVTSHRLLHPKTGLYAFANQYKSVYGHANNGSVLVFAHGTSNHKEQWEPVISATFRQCKGVIDEAWSLDCQSHGHSGVLNESALRDGRAVSIEDYADLLRHFVQSDLVARKRVLAVGHSGSTVAWTLAAFETTSPVSPIAAFVFFEAVHMIPPTIHDDLRVVRGATNIKAAGLRKTAFASMEEAEKYTRSQYPWKKWDERVIQSYLNHGLTTLFGSTRVVTSCKPTQEAWLYEPYVYLLGGHLYTKLCATFPVHLIFSERAEMFSEKTRDGFYDGRDGRNPASVHILPKCGHLLVQEKPDESADILSRIILQIDTNERGDVKPRL
ncbi:hypothetical protein K439DRAFT_1642402 [Ramaria rubella]|nr:hypothetical protein K439DRAFT_1642402 [Ramaria rubella]